MAALLALGLVKGTAQANPAFVDGAQGFSWGPDPSSGNLVTAASIQVGYETDPNAQFPGAYDVYHLRVVATGLLLPTRALIWLQLPPNTQLAIDDAHPVVCHATANGQTNVDFRDCPQALPLTPKGFAIQATTTPDGNWPLPPGAAWEIQVPVRSKAAMTGGLAFTSAVVSAATTTFAFVGVSVFQSHPRITYPAPSTTSAAPGGCDTGGQCRVDGQCPPAEVCFCGQRYASVATLSGNGEAGSMFFELGKSAGDYSEFTDTGNVPADQGETQLSSNWVPHVLTAGTTYHWRARFAASAGTTLGADQSFLARWPNVNWCGPATIASQSRATNPG